METLELLTDYGNVRTYSDIARRRGVKPGKVKNCVEHIWDKLFDGNGRIDRISIGMTYIAAKNNGTLLPVSD